MQYCSRELSDSSQTCRGSGHALLTSSCTLLYCTNKENSSFSWNLTCIGAAFSFPKFLVMFTGPGCWSYLKHPYNGFFEQMASLIFAVDISPNSGFQFFQVLACRRRRTGNCTSSWPSSSRSSALAHSSSSSI